MLLRTPGEHVRRARRCSTPSPQPSLPATTLADEPLLLYSCAYGGLSFRRSQPNYALVRTQLEGALHR